MIDYWIGRASAQFTVRLPFAPGNGNYDNFNEYFTALVNFAVIVAGLVAVLVIVYAGFVYVQSQGQADRVSQAKELIAGALTGLILLFLTRLILPTLNIGHLPGSSKAHAQVPVDQLDLGSTNLPDWTWDRLLDSTVGLLTGVVAVAALAGVIYSGYMIITAGGDPGQAAKGRSNLLWSVLGLIVAITAYTIVTFAFNLGASI